MPKEEADGAAHYIWGLGRTDFLHFYLTETISASDGAFSQNSTGDLAEIRYTARHRINTN
jgi:hypothetical protein